MDQCTRTFSVAKACIMLPKHRWFGGCKINAGCFNASLPAVVETFAQQVCNKYSDIKDSAEVVAAALKYVSAVDRMKERKMRLM